MTRRSKALDPKTCRGCGQTFIQRSFQYCHDCRGKRRISEDSRARNRLYQKARRRGELLPTLVIRCKTCGVDFQEERRRGRANHHCPEHRAK